MYSKIQKDIENLKSSAKKYLADKETLELINKFINNYGHIDNINSIDVQDDYDSDYYEILNILHDYELIHSFDQVNILYTKAKKQFTEISNKQAGFDPDFANLQASFHQFEKFVTTNTKVLVDEYHTLHNIKQKFKELHNKFNIDLKQINLKSISNDDNDVEKIIQGDDKVIITKYNQVKSLLNQSKIKIPLSIAGVVGGYLLACKIAKQVPGLNITNNPLNNFKQFLKLRPLNSKREALALAVLIGAAYSAYQLGKSLVSIIKNKAKSKREFADSLSTKENRYKSDKKIIEEAILEKDWEVLKSMRNDRRLKEFPDLVKMVEEALKSKPLTESQEVSEPGTYVSVKVKNAQSLYDHFKKQGVDVIPAEELHCTIAYSRKTFEHEENKDEIRIRYDEDIVGIEPLGDEGAIVMKLASHELKDRFDKCIKEGATYDYPKYQPHITITYNGEGLDLDKLEKPDFDIYLYDETTESLNENWKEDLDEKSEKEKEKGKALTESTTVNKKVLKGFNSLLTQLDVILGEIDYRLSRKVFDNLERLKNLYSNYLKCLLNIANTIKSFTDEYRVEANKLIQQCFDMNFKTLTTSSKDLANKLKAIIDKASTSKDIANVKFADMNFKIDDNLLLNIVRSKHTGTSKARLESNDLDYKTIFAESLIDEEADQDELMESALNRHQDEYMNSINRISDASGLRRIIDKLRKDDILSVRYKRTILDAAKNKLQSVSGRMESQGLTFKQQLNAIDLMEANTPRRAVLVMKFFDELVKKRGVNKNTKNSFDELIDYIQDKNEFKQDSSLKYTISKEYGQSFDNFKAKYKKIFSEA